MNGLQQLLWVFQVVGFDDEILRREFFKSLRKPYLINTEGNSRHDALNMIKAAFAIDENVLKTELNPKGNKSMKLESLARLNGFEFRRCPFCII